MEKKLNHAVPDSTSNRWELGPDHVDLKADEIHLWRAYLDCGETVLHRFEATLSSDEKGRAARFSFPRDRNAFVVTRGILRELVGRYAGRAAADVEFDYNPQGKPFLRDSPAELSVEFNVSHSHGIALLSFAVGRQLGVDVEFIRADQANETIAERYFSPQEIVELRALPPSLRAEGFFLCWTRKEAYIKARGEGFRIPLTSFSVRLTPGRPARLESEDCDRWSLLSVNPGPRFAGALVGEGRGWRTRAWSWNYPAADDSKGIPPNSI